MKKILFLIVMCSCVKTPTLLTTREQNLKGIPFNSSQIIVDANIGADSLFSSISRSLVSRKWIISSSREGLQISCEGREMVGKVFVRPLVQIERISSNKSRAIYRGLWSMNKMQQEDINFFIGPYKEKDKAITWQGWNTKSGVAFEHLKNIAGYTPDAVISYAQ